MRSIIVLALVAGCYPEVTTTATTTTRELESFAAGPARQLVLAVERHDTAVVVSASWPRRCTGRVVDQVTTKTDSSLRLAGTSGGQTWGYGLILPLVIAYPIGLTDLVLAGGITLASRKDDTQSTRVHTAIETSCDLPAAHVAIQLVLASGGVVDGVTDDRGEVVYMLASAEDRFFVRAGNAEQVTPDIEVPFRR